MGLRELREKRGLTQQQLAERVGTTRGRISAYEIGAIPAENMTLGTSLKICDALRVSNPRKLVEDSMESPKENKPTE
ncbi:helix-turn-helix transcriptional regulator [Bifidobacterium eulemuris]|uniref:Helix-turn-helix transcriptional regulator n=1 Tax=Bifidobacterium eulemuris TaxID=1765219 RepID=A0A261GA28_9BIFI|nr:helix-turn-helix transcriptional regulator [Bifidobacterium eulemuris]OZG68264.1 the helix-turn-helix motif [Bifidobacterium eulemuris]QOL31680.1 helix-turn-helix transcriptional regulator [Bifidobacterium eulemuris]